MQFHDRSGAKLPEIPNLQEQTDWQRHETTWRSLFSVHFNGNVPKRIFYVFTGVSQIWIISLWTGLYVKVTSLGAIHCNSSNENK